MVLNGFKPLDNIYWFLTEKYKKNQEKKDVILVYMY